LNRQVNDLPDDSAILATCDEKPNREIDEKPPAIFDASLTVGGLCWFAYASA
jgi:hypothetical protein